MKKILYIIFVITTIIACSEKQEYIDTLNRAKEAMNNNADSALMILDSLEKHKEEFNNHFKMQYQLHRMNAYNKLDTIFRSTKEAQTLVDYFNDNGTYNEQMLAYYLLGRAYFDTHEIPMALSCYQIATEKADTNDINCNYRQLSRIYGQMNNIFYAQNLMRHSIEYSDYEEKYAWKANDTINALKSIGGRIGAYMRLQIEDSVIIMSKRVSDLFFKFNYKQLSAGYMAILAKAYLNKGYIQEAKNCIDIYESQSGFFDNQGNIVNGREAYYYTKGLYYLAIQKYDSAEYVFRKELLLGKDFNNQNISSRGLALLFQQKHMGDSAAKYALYSYEMNDSVYANMATKEVEQMQGMYNYSRHQEIARQEKERADKEQKMVNTILSIMVISILVIVYIARIVYEKRKAEKQAYIQKVSDLAKAQIEITKLRSIAEHTEELSQLITEKESQIADMANDIESYKERLGFQKKSAESVLEETDVYKDLQKKAVRAIVLNDNDWHQINVMAIEVLPNFYKFISSKKLDLNDKEFKTCILVRMHFTPKDIANMLGVSQSYITKIRNHMMPKLFGIEGNSKELDNRIMQFT